MNLSELRVVLILLIAVIVSPACAATEEGAPMSNSQLNETLKNFAVENGVTTYDLASMLSSWTWNSAKIAKGGVGVIDESTYLMLRARQNSLVLNHKTWTGGASSQVEIVAITDGEVVSGGEVPPKEVDIVVIFLPDEIIFLDLKSGASGKYARMK